MSSRRRTAPSGAFTDPLEAGQGCSRKDPNYIGTELLRNAIIAHCYVTVDRWASRTAYYNFKKRHQNEFVALDARCEALTVRESKIGEFSSGDKAFLFASERQAAKSFTRRRPKRPS